MELWIFWSFGNSLVSITAISFVSLLAIYAVLSICFFARRRWIRGERPQDPHIHEFNGMSHHSVKVMPTVNFTAVVEGDCTSSICSICLEDYNLGEKLRILPCCHRFHAICVDVWLKSWRTFCPVCKRDARTSAGEPPASECTPFLLPSSLASTYASSVLSSVNLSSALQICSSSRYSSVSLPM